MISIGENSLGFRIFIFIVGISFIGVLNFLFFAFFLGYTYNWYLVFFTIFLGILLFYMINRFRYLYKIKENVLYIKTPNKKDFYKIPFKDIKKVVKIKKIPFVYRFGMKFDPNKNILYLNGFCSRGILLKLQTHDIVISPRKCDNFYKNLKERI